MLRPLTAVRLLDAWDAALDAPPSQRGVALLAACRGLDADAVAHWTVTARDAELFTLRIELFGALAQAVITCPHCTEPLDVDLDLAELRPVGHDGDELAGLVDGRAVVARLPTTHDVVMAGAEIGDAGGALVRRCVTSVSGTDGTVLDDELERALRSWMAAQLEPHEVVLAMACSACAERIEVSFDIGSFVVADVEAWAEQAIHEVHVLATAYGWTQDEVLALSARRRARYLDLVDGGPELWPTP